MTNAESAALASQPYPSGLLAPDLPLDRARGASRQHPGAWVRDDAPSPLAERLAAAAPAAGVTPHIWLLSVFVALLARYTRQTDFLVAVGFDPKGTTAEPGRMPVRLTIDPSRPFSELLQATGMAVATAATGLPIDPQQQPAIAFDACGDGATDVPEPDGPSPYELGISVRQHLGALAVAVFRAADLVDEESAYLWARHYRSLLTSSLADPGAASAALDAMDEDERRVLVAGWSRQNADAGTAGFHRMVERHAAARPDAAAVAFDGERSLTYRQLEQQANRLAHELRARGVGPEVVVGLCLERSPEMIVAQVAVLKAGGAFLPLDPGYPGDRLAFMVDDSGARLLVVSGATQGRLSSSPVARLNLEELSADPAARSASPPQTAEDPEQLAYVIYTSGSTGRPKGVLVPHRGLANLGRALAEVWDLNGDSQHLLFASFGFDASVADLASAFTAGATVHLARPEEQFPGPPLLRLLEERGITHVCLPPSTLAVLGNASLPRLRSICVAGEACSQEVVARWAPGRRFSNAYGPTECTVAVSAEVCAPDGRRPPIGRPIPNVRAYVVDEGLRLVPIGVPGELLVGGIGVARGYVNRPELTAERFIEDPFCPSGGRLYRTGDLVRWLADGRLDFIGRVDDQVKVRGYRIEIGEIEASLAALSGVRDAAVVAHGEGAEKRLVAFVVVDSGTGADLRAKLQERLPSYMVPSIIERLDRLPVTPNGKIDRRGLRDRAGLAMPPDLGHAEPFEGEGLEAEVAEAWREAAGIARAGLDDNFFDLGGQSLTLVRVQQRLEQRLARPIPTTDLFAFPTIRTLARHLARGEAANAAAAAGDRARLQREALTRARPRPTIRGRAQGAGETEHE